MNSLVILGAGQFGRACSSLINTEFFRLIAFGDNSPSLRGTFLKEIPVLSVEDAIASRPDCILIAVSGQERSDALLHQAQEAGFRGKVLFLQDLRQLLDIRSAVLCRMADRLKAGSVPGAIGELGVYRGFTAGKLNALFPDRPLYLFDTFEGFSSQDIKEETARSCSFAREGEFSDTSEQLVLSLLPFPRQAVIRKGFFPDSAEGLEHITYALVSLDADLYAPILAGLRYFFPRLSPGGMILLHDYNNDRFRGAHQAVDAYEAESGPLSLVPLCDLHGTAVIVKPF